MNVDVNEKLQTRIGWDAPGTRIMGTASVRRFFVKTGRRGVVCEEGRLENDVRIMAFTLPHDLYTKLHRSAGTQIAVTYNGYAEGAKQFTVEPAEHIDDTGAAEYAAALERAAAEAKAKRDAEDRARREAAINRLTPAYGRELAERLTATIDGVVLRRDGGVEYRLVHREWGFGPRDKNVDNVVGVITGRPRQGSMTFVTPAELLQAVRS